MCVAMFRIVDRKDLNRNVVSDHVNTGSCSCVMTIGHVPFTQRFGNYITQFLLYLSFSISDWLHLMIGSSVWKFFFGLIIQMATCFAIGNLKINFAISNSICKTAVQSSSLTRSRGPSEVPPVNQSLNEDVTAYIKAHLDERTDSLHSQLNFDTKIAQWIVICIKKTTATWKAIH